MAKYKNMIGFCLAIDAMSQHIWAVPITNKSAPTIKKALTIIFDSIQKPIGEACSWISEVASDQGN